MRDDDLILLLDFMFVRQSAPQRAKSRLLENQKKECLASLVRNFTNMNDITVDALCALATHASLEDGTRDHALHLTALRLARVNNALHSASEPVRHIQGANDRLKRAIELGAQADLEIALADGASVHTWPGDPSYDASPLHAAVSFGRLEVVRLLLHHGADPRRVNAFGQTPLHCLESGAASREAAREMVALLVAAGAQVHARDARFRTPLTACVHAYWTARGPDPALRAPIEALLQHGATLSEGDALYVDFV
jgi:Ankyrin repeats (many copies)